MKTIKTTPSQNRVSFAIKIYLKPLCILKSAPTTNNALCVSLKKKNKKIETKMQIRHTEIARPETIAWQIENCDKHKHSAHAYTYRHHTCLLASTVARYLSPCTAIKRTA